MTTLMNLADIMLNGRSQTQGYTVWFCLYEVLEEAKRDIRLVLFAGATRMGMESVWGEETINWEGV